MLDKQLAVLQTLPSPRAEPTPPTAHGAGPCSLHADSPPWEKWRVLSGILKSDPNPVQADAQQGRGFWVGVSRYSPAPQASWAGSQGPWGCCRRPRGTSRSQLSPPRKRARPSTCLKVTTLTPPRGSVTSPEGPRHGPSHSRQAPRTWKPQGHITREECSTPSRTLKVKFPDRLSAHFKPGHLR